MLWELFCVFARVGVCTFGGGYAMLPMLQRELVDARGWATESELMNYYAIGQCTPGVIAVNTATFMGYKKAGVRGAIAAMRSGSSDGYPDTPASALENPAARTISSK